MACAVADCSCSSRNSTILQRVTASALASLRACLCLTLCCVTLVSLMQATHASPARLVDCGDTIQVGARPQTCASQVNAVHAGDEVPQGVRSYLTKKAVQLIAAAFRHGGDVLAYVVKWLDDDAAKAVAKNSGRIADALNDIAKIPGLTTNIVREKLYYFLKESLSLSGGVSLQIADAVAATIDWLLL